MVERILESYRHIPYTFKHYLVFMKTQKKILGYYKYKFHDFDKLMAYIFMPFLGTEYISQWHQLRSNHHPTYKIGEGDKKVKKLKPEKEVCWEEAIIDWECARITKPDKPLDAYDTLHKFYPEYIEVAKPELIRLGLSKNL